MAFMAGLAFPDPGSALAEETPISTVIREDVNQTMAVEKKVQDMKTQWSGESKALADKRKTLEASVADLENHLEKITLRLDLETARHEENLRREKEMARVQAELAVFLDGVLSRLEAFVRSDLPFLTKERHARLTALKIMMVDPQISSAEKFRRIFEALQIETEYGISVESTQATVTLDQVDVLVDLLRLGRVSLFCQAIDGKKSAVFDPAQKTWQTLPEGVNRDLSRAIAMARLERSIELVKLPLGRIAAQ